MTRRNFIYIVIGTTGEYSDRTEWAVKAFTNKNSAERFIIEVTKIANEIKVNRGNKYKFIPQNSNPLDPKMEMDYTGTSYFYYETELVGD